MMGRAIEKPLQAPWGYLFPQTHGNCLLGTICHPPKLLLFSSYSQPEMLHGNLHETASSFQLDAHDTRGTTMGWYNSECTWHSYSHPIFFSDLAKLLFSATCHMINATVSYTEKHFTFFVLISHFHLGFQLYKGIDIPFPQLSLFLWHLSNMCPFNRSDPILLVKFPQVFQLPTILTILLQNCIHEVWLITSVLFKFHSETGGHKQWF